MDEVATMAASRGTGRKLVGLVLALAVVIIGWTSGWFWLKGEVSRRMDEQLVALEQRGVHVDCPDRTVGGWPFRIDIDCSNVSVKQINQLTAVSLRHVRLAALIYQPTLAIVELDGPMSLTGPNGETVNATWTRLRSSIGFSLSPSIRPQRLAIEAEDLAATAARPGGQEIKLTAAHAEAHGRPDPDAKADANDLDVSLTLTAATVSVGGRMVGPEATDYGLNSVARDLPATRVPGELFLKTWADEGGRLDLRSVRMALGGFAIEGQGYVTAGSDGQANGKIELIASGLGALMSPKAASLKGRAELLGLATAFSLFGKSVTAPAAPGSAPGTTSGRSLELTIDQGKARIGRTDLGRLPALF